MSKWIDIEKQKPRDGQKILTNMKHGVIAGYWCESEGFARAYYWRDMEFFISQWIDFDEFQEMMKEQP